VGGGGNTSMGKSPTVTLTSDICQMTESLGVQGGAEGGGGGGPVFLSILL
jgi:hypothetical protein